MNSPKWALSLLFFFLLFSKYFFSHTELITLPMIMQKLNICYSLSVFHNQMALPKIECFPFRTITLRSWWDAYEYLRILLNNTSNMSLFFQLFRKQQRHMQLLSKLNGIIKIPFLFPDLKFTVAFIKANVAGRNHSCDFPVPKFDYVIWRCLKFLSLRAFFAEYL